MKGAVTVTLAIALSAAAYHYYATKVLPPERLLLASTLSPDAIDGCIEAYGSRAKPGLAKIDITRGFASSGSTYVTGEGDFRVTLDPGANAMELRVRAAWPLTAEQIAVFRKCAG